MRNLPPPARAYVVATIGAAAVLLMLFAGVPALPQLPLYALLLAMPLCALPIYLAFRAHRVYASQKENEYQHRQIVESLSEGMAVVQTDGTIALWNDALERITGLSRERVIGKTLGEALPFVRGT